MIDKAMLSGFLRLILDQDSGLVIVFGAFGETVVQPFPDLNIVGLEAVIEAVLARPDVDICTI